MKFKNAVIRFGASALVTVLGFGASGCGDADVTGEGETDPDEIVGANAVARMATIKSYVLVRPGTSDGEIRLAITQQMRPLFGAMKEIDVGLSDRDADDIDTSTFQRDTVNVVDPARPEMPVQPMLRVRFTYRDRAVVPNALARRRNLPTTTLAGDYFAHAQQIIAACQSEHRDWGASGIWYNFEPGQYRCQELIRAETQRITQQRRRLRNADREVTVDEMNRWFQPLSVQLTTIRRTETRYPDYHRMFDDDKLVVASYFGVDKLDDPNDYGARNFFIYLRTVLAARPELRLSTVAPATDLTRVAWRGSNLTGVTLERVANWIVDGRDYPTQVSTADRSAFRRQVIAQWRDRTLGYAAPATVTINGAARRITLEVRAFYGNEEGYDSGAVQRYQQAFQQVDVFQYTGHSHLGSGALDARNYSAANFPDRYQILMVNSCVSFNYYNEYFAMHPGGTRNLDTVTNALPVYLEGSGLSSARFTNAFLDGRFRSYVDILRSMVVDVGWEEHDPSRVADGEADNTFTPSSYRMTLAVPMPASR